MKFALHRSTTFRFVILGAAVAAFLAWDTQQWIKRKTLEDEARYQALKERVERADRERIENARKSWAPENSESR